MVTRRTFLAAACGSFAGPARAAAPRDDLLITGGRVIDPASRTDRVADVAIQGGRIRAVQPGLASGAAARVFDARGQIVTPGWIDVHVHVGAPDLTPAALLPDGVTSMVDAGSSGADNVDALVRVAQASSNRVRIFLNVARTGTTAAGELHDLAAADVPAAKAAIARHRDWIVGVKVRLSESVCGDQDLEALRRARAVAGPLPVMLHVGQTYSPIPKILELLQPGDIVTHPYSPPPHTILDEQGRVLPEVIAARKRGIRFDVGNGRTAHITWPMVDAATKNGFWPDTISSDITGPGRTFRAFDLPTVVSKFLMLGLPLPDAIADVTVHAADAIRAFRGLGALRAGAPADVAILELRTGQFEFVDNVDATRTGRQKLVPTAVVMAGSLRQPERK